jgi:hypothetical protein
MVNNRTAEQPQPEWRPEQTLPILRQKLAELQELRKHNNQEVSQKYDIWQLTTRNVLINGFGRDHGNVRNFDWAFYAKRNMNQQADFLSVSAKQESAVISSIEQLMMIVPDITAERGGNPNLSENQPDADQHILVLISHSSKDKVLAEALIDLLRAGLGLVASQIRCSSVDGYRLPAGVNTDDQLRIEIKAVKVLIGLLTPNSLSSTYVLFELGARWGAELFMIPLLAGTKPHEMRGPHSVINALSCESDSQLIQLVEDIGRKLKMPPQSTSSYLKQLHEVRTLSDSLEGPTGAAVQGHKSIAAKAEFPISVKTEGSPPSQLLRVTSSQPIKMLRVEYMLSNGACIVSDDVSLQGELIEVPLKYGLLTQLLNTPRVDRNGSDNSGPVKFGLTFTAG